jgi:hypothetical protein
MPVNTARPPVNPAYKVRPYYAPDNSKKVFDAKWGVAQTAPSSPVVILAASRIRIESKFAKIEIYQFVDGKKYDVCSFQVPIVGGSKVNHSWTADPVKSGNFEEGIYHFYISTGLFWGETQTPLLIRDITNRNADMFIPQQNNLKMPKF